MQTRLFLLILLCVVNDLMGQNLVKNASFEKSIPHFPKNRSVPSPHFRTSRFEEYHALSGGFLTVPNSTPDVITSDNKLMEFSDFNKYVLSDFEAKSGKIATGIRLLGCKISDICCREVIQIPLTEPMVTKEKYHIEFWASRMVTSPAIPLSIYFATDSLFHNPMDAGHHVKPQIVTDTMVGTIKFQWVRIADTIMAAANYRFMSIGNFYNRDAETPQRVVDTGKTSPFSYYFIDDVAVIPLSKMKISAPALSLSDLNFVINSWTLTPKARTHLDSFARSLTNCATCQLTVIGNTDNKGTPESNIILSEKRAQSVRNYLISKGIKEANISTLGKGEAEPIADNATEQGRQKNRRVEVFIRQ